MRVNYILLIEVVSNLLVFGFLIEIPVNIVILLDLRLRSITMSWFLVKCFDSIVIIIIQSVSVHWIELIPFMMHIIWFVLLNYIFHILRPQKCIQVKWIINNDSRGVFFPATLIPSSLVETMSILTEVIFMDLLIEVVRLRVLIVHIDWFITVSCCYGLRIEDQTFGLSVNIVSM